jgi:hypothetical protein
VTPTADKPETKPGSKPEAKDDLKSLPMPEVEKQLGSSADGLSQAEAQKRLTQYVPNEITEKKTNPFLKFLTYFWGSIPWMIEVAVILSGVVGHWPDFFILLKTGSRRRPRFGKTRRNMRSPHQRRREIQERKACENPFEGFPCAPGEKVKLCQVLSFKQPNADELEHDFLWRTSRLCRNATSTHQAHRYVVPADDKENPRLSVQLQTK